MAKRGTSSSKASSVIKSNVARSGTKGNKKPPLKRTTSHNQTDHAIGGHAGANFDNIGK